MKKNVKRINESQLRAIVAESVKKVLKENVEEDKFRFQEYFMNWVNDGKTSWEPLGDTYSEALENLEQEGYKFVREIDDDLCLYVSSDGVYYIVDIEEDQDGGWGSYFVELNTDAININESTLNEYQLWDLTKRVGAGLSTLTGPKGGNFSQKFQRAKANFKTQGEINDMNELLMKLQKYVDMKVFSPNATIAELIGNKWMAKGDKQGIKQHAGGLRGNITQRGGQWH